jgi:hypothetical protein
MMLDKDPFPVNMNMVELNGKKVIVWPSQTESIKGKTEKSKRWPMSED